MMYGYNTCAIGVPFRHFSTRAVHVGLIGAGNTDRQVIPTPLLFWRGWLTEGEMFLASHSTICSSSGSPQLQWQMSSSLSSSTSSVTSYSQSLSSLKSLTSHDAIMINQNTRARWFMGRIGQKLETLSWLLVATLMEYFRQNYAGGDWRKCYW